MKNEEEIRDKIEALEDDSIYLHRRIGNSDEVDAQIDILNWVLGENESE